MSELNYNTFSIAEKIELLKRNIPDEMQSRPQWVVWRIERDTEGRARKVPYNPRNPNRGAKQNDPTTWDSFERTLGVFQNSMDTNEGAFNGIGFEFSGDDPYVGIDLDHLIENDGRLRWLQKCGSYAEWSQSGEGIHIILRGKLPECSDATSGGTRTSGKKNDKLGVEIYQTSRYFALTGNVLEGYTAIVDNQAAIDEFFNTYWPDAADKPNVAERPSVAERPKEYTLNTGGVAAVRIGTPPPVSTTPNDDESLLQLAMDAANGGKFKRLWGGDISAYDNDHSRADFALLEMLAFWTRRDAVQMERLFKKSALHRPDGKHKSYLSRTIKKAIVGCTEVYTPQTKGMPSSDDGATQSTKSTPRTSKVDKVTEIEEALAELGHVFSLNILENQVFVDGQLLDDIRADKIHCELVRKSITNFALMDKVFNMLADSNHFHPIVHYLDGLVWDGDDHIQKLLNYVRFEPQTIEYEDGFRGSYGGTMLHKWLLGVVTQVYESVEHRVVKFQNPMLVFSGAQGGGKSTLARWLCPISAEEYHVEGSIDPQKDEHHRLAVNKLIWEVTEIGATMRKSDKDALKGFLTQTQSTYRVPWGKRPITKPRMVSYVGTVNPETGFLSDVTGERRYIPVNVESIDWGYAQNVDVNQIWAQVVFEYKRGVRPQLTPEEKRAVESTQGDHKIDNPLSTMFQHIFDIDPTQTEWVMHTSEIITKFNLRSGSDRLLPSDTKFAAAKVAEVLMGLGLKPSKNMRIGGAQGKGYAGIRLKEDDMSEQEMAEWNKGCDIGHR